MPGFNYRALSKARVLDSFIPSTNIYLVPGDKAGSKSFFPWRLNSSRETDHR